MTSSKTPDLVFEEPPPPSAPGRKAGTSPIGLWLTTLREHPGKWAKCPDQVRVSSVGSVIKRGKGYGAKPGEFDAVVRTGTNKRYWLYVRYIGGES